MLFNWRLMFALRASDRHQNKLLLFTGASFQSRPQVSWNAGEGLLSGFAVKTC